LLCKNNTYINTNKIYFKKKPQPFSWGKHKTPRNVLPTILVYSIFVVKVPFTGIERSLTIVGTFNPLLNGWNGFPIGVLKITRMEILCQLQD
jgi:hypothetical protein